MKAYPDRYYTRLGDHVVHEGMDLRDYFAAKVLPALLFDINSIAIDMNKTAKLAYSYADAMMEARK
jgi:hypothetical protein